LLLFCFSYNTQAQKETNNWFFAQGSGLDFGSDPPRLIEGQTNGYNGTASISDSEGNLLFYTDGFKVWNRAHRVMPNGSGLNASTSAGATPVMIVPWPETDSLYYIFVTPQSQLSRPFSYSLVDMRLDNGMGDVTEKNVGFTSRIVQPRISAVHHSNGIDVWVLVHEEESDLFLSYLVDEEGIQEKPVINKIGIKNELFNVGELKFSVNGKKIAMASVALGVVELFDFNNTTGELSNLTTLSDFESVNGGPYGIAFSPNNEFLYVTDGFSSVSVFLDNDSHLYQYSLTQNQNIEATRRRLSKNLSSWGMQLASDGKIYVAGVKDGFFLSVEEEFLSVINAPDKEGIDADFEFEGLNLDKEISPLAALPNFIQSFFTPCRVRVNLPEDTLLCDGESLKLSATEVKRSGSFLWNNGSDDSTINVTTSDKFWVSFQYLNCVSSDTINVEFTEGPTTEFEEDTISIFSDETITLDFSGDTTDSLIWDNGSTDLLRVIDEPGMYWFNARNRCGMKSDTLYVRIQDVSIPNVFTPNNDGINDYFQIDGISDDGWSLTVYNRYEKIVFQTSDYKNDWDGQGLPSGIYYYMVMNSAENKTFKGWLHLLR